MIAQRPELYTAVGGHEGLTSIITDFYDRLFDDVMIGFMFLGRDKARLIKHEVQFTARMLGAEVSYEGQPVVKAHARLPIMGGQFNRRLRILEDTLEDHAVPEAVRQVWLGHTERLRGAILGKGVHPDRCSHDAQAARVRGDGDS
ncbi:MAG: group I truncated hemoglobin [Bradymonadia bacterium]